VKRTITLPAACLPSLNVALDALMRDIEAGNIPEWGQDDHPGTMLITIERSDLPALKLVGAA
jgi:hypothetical protein